jgi:Family of unknown function (DUF6352)
VFDLSETFLLGILASPQLALVPESCASEAALHKALRATPCKVIEPAELAAVEDADARDNYVFYQRLQAEVQAAGSLKAYYWQLIKGEVPLVPPEVLDTLTEQLTNDMLDGLLDKNIAVQYAAAEWFYQRQAVHLEDGRVVHDVARDSVRDPLDLSHGMVNELSHGLLFRLSNANSGLKALSQVIEKWVAYMLDIEITVKSLAKVDDAAWRWHIGLEATSTAILNDLYLGKEVNSERLSQLVSLFKLEFKNPSVVQTDMTSRPVYLGLAMDANGFVKIKPQNLLLNLPINLPLRSAS